jgi:hypothetical protein
MLQLKYVTYETFRLKINLVLTRSNFNLRRVNNLDFIKTNSRKAARKQNGIF